MKNLAFAVILTLGWAGACSAQQGEGSKQGSPADRHSEAELLKELQQVLIENPAVPITRPRGYTPPVPKPYMPQDGSLVVNRRCRITFHPETGWYLLTLLPARDGKAAGKTVPRWILPSKWLAAVEKELAGKGSGLFRITGETTVYKNRAFILLRNLKADRRGRSDMPAREAGDKQKAEPAEEDTNKPEVKSTRADKIAAELLRSRPGRPVHVPRGAGTVGEAPSVAPKAEVRQIDEDRGEMRIDRLVRFEFDEQDQWWLARFESDNTLQDQPVRLLPCKLLELAEKETRYYAGRQKTYRARISGVLTSYKGWRYLLLRKLVKEREMGAF